MIELDLNRRRLAWPGASCGGLPSSMAERPSRIWFHVACLQRSREGISREGISGRAVRLSERHLSSLYDGVDDFVRGPNVTGPTKRNHSSRCECAANPRLRRRIVLGSIFSPFFSRQVFSPSLLAKFPAKFESALSVDDLCRQRNLANAASTHSSVATRVGQRSVPFMVAGCVALHLQLQPSMLHRTSI
jgi:hypothetical protein